MGKDRSQLTASYLGALGDEVQGEKSCASLVADGAIPLTCWADGKEKLKMGRGL